MEIPERLRATMRRFGLDYAGPIYVDGKLHRFRAAGDKARNSWYVLFGGALTAGNFGCWRRQISEPWCERDENRTQADWGQFRERLKQADAERERSEVERHAKARKVAVWILSRSKPADASHPYLKAKCVGVYGDLFEYRGALGLPLRDVDGELNSIQFIGPDGLKRFLTDGCVTGCFFTLADKPDCPLVICEGYATGASIHEATGFAVVCAMNCGNLLAIAKAVREKQPQRETIIAADNDQFTQGNPGLTKATEAAKSIGARLAVPQFGDTTTKPTDFNDLARLEEGLDQVRQQIAKAEMPKESDDDVIARLAALPLLEYERQRKVAAEQLGCREAILDKLVVDKRPRPETAEGESLQGRAVTLPDVEPWPDPVDGADVLNQVAERLASYVALPPGAADAMALWIAHAHLFIVFICSPRLNIWSPEKGCGKTTLRDVIAVFVPRPLPTENLSLAVLFRVTHSNRPVILGDECDRYLHDNDELLGLLNAGHRRGGQALRCEGDNHEVRAFQVFAPAVLCGIGNLPGTLHDRSIQVRLQRAKPGELRERFDSRRVERETELCRKLARWTADHSARLAEADPAMPPGAFNRLADNWRPLFAIAEVAGGSWPQRAASAFTKLTSNDDMDAQGVGTMLLADISGIFTATGEDRLESKNLASALAEMEGRPWAEWGRAHKPISANQLATQLRRFEVFPRTIRVEDKTPKGYLLADFSKAFDRYLPSLPLPDCNNATTAANTNESSDFKPQQSKSMLHPENATSTNKDGACCIVAVQKPGVMEEDAEKETLRL